MNSGKRKADLLYDIVIQCEPSLQQEHFFQERLNLLLFEILNKQIDMLERPCFIFTSS